MRRGIYCGTFDPVHTGHIAFALAAKDAASLDKVVFVPETEPWRKAHVTPIGHRVKLLELALEQHEGCGVATLSQGKLTVHRTMAELVSFYPNDTLALLMGSDVARHLPQWKGINQLLDKVEFVIGMRSDDTTEEITEVMQQLAAIYNQPVSYQLVITGQSHVSSSHIRDNADLHHPIPSVQAYIHSHQLYGNK